MMRNLLLIISCLLLSNCKKSFSLEINENMKNDCYEIRGDKNTMTGNLHINIEENTFNDTIIIDNIKLPPSKIGEYEVITDYYVPGVKLCFDKYKATKGRIIFSATF